MTKRRDDAELYDGPNIHTTTTTTDRLCRRTRVVDQQISRNWLSQYDPETFSSLVVVVVVVVDLWYGEKEDRELCLYWAGPAGCPLYLLHIPPATLWRANGLPTSIVIQPVGEAVCFICIFFFFLEFLSFWNSEMSANIDVLVIMSYRSRPSMNLLLENILIVSFYC